ncbi:hypothetical protein XAC29_13440 [Xanthomonas axonopodis Xac29-1]|nr:hypothetical protein XAC29_13440 [Xanthomonas axonopodis Xac29-1]
MFSAKKQPDHYAFRQVNAALPPQSYWPAIYLQARHCGLPAYSPPPPTR